MGIKRAKKSKNEAKALAAIKRAAKANDQELLFKIALRTTSLNAKKKKYEDDVVGLAVVDKLTDQDTLYYIATNAHCNDVREAATEKLTDQALLANIAKSEDFQFVTGIAVNKLTDQKLLADVAINCSVGDICKKAFTKIEDPMLLADIAKNSKHIEICIFALDKIADITLFADIAEQAEYEYIKREAILKLTDQIILDEINKGNVDLSSNIMVLKKLILSILARTKMASEYSETSIIQSSVAELLKLNRAIADHAEKVDKRDSTAIKRALGVIGVLVLLKDLGELIDQLIKLFSQLLDFIKNGNRGNISASKEKLHRIQTTLVQNYYADWSFDNITAQISTEMEKEAAAKAAEEIKKRNGWQVTISR